MFNIIVLTNFCEFISLSTSAERGYCIRKRATQSNQLLAQSSSCWQPLHTIVNVRLLYINLSISVEGGFSVLECIQSVKYSCLVSWLFDKLQSRRRKRLHSVAGVDMRAAAGARSNTKPIIDEINQGHHELIHISLVRNLEWQTWSCIVSHGISTSIIRNNYTQPPCPKVTEFWHWTAASTLVLPQ